MSLFQLHISTDNAAFGDHPGYELARVLRRVASKLTNGAQIDDLDGLPIMDGNGNRVGKVWAGSYLTREAMAEVFRGLIQRVDEIHERSAEAQSLDSGEALELLEHIREVCKAAIFEDEGGA